jgi:hypothetical protein
MSAQKAKPRRLRVYWDKREKDLTFYHPTQRADGHLLHYVFNCVALSSGLSFVQELKQRGFDVTTLKFSVDLIEKEAAE